MREEYNSILSTPTETDNMDISVKPKYWPMYQPSQYISLSLVINEVCF